MRREGRTVNGKRERQEKVSNERQRFYRQDAESDLQLSFNTKIPDTFCPFG